MTPEQFCYWLQGFKELHGQTPTSIQWVQIMQHLDTVFHKITPYAPNKFPKDNVTTPLPCPNPLDTWKDHKLNVMC